MTSRRESTVLPEIVTLRLLLESALFFVKKHLNKGSTIKAFDREDSYEIPLEVLREAIVNALMHRDYSLTGTQVSLEIYDDRIEISNPGGAPANIYPNGLGKISIRRNEILANLFFRIGKVEKIGSGISRMRGGMKKANLPEPEFESNGIL